MSGPFTSGREDRLYDLLPAVYRQRDADQGYALRDLLRVIAEQVNAVEDDIGQLYENWFIETCQDWVVPYIGDLIGYRSVHDAGEPGEAGSPAGQRRNRVLFPRRDVGNTLRSRRRKGTLALLEQLAQDVAGWPARAVEFYRLVAFTQSLNHLRLRRGRTVDVRRAGDLIRLGGPFERLAHTADVRRVASAHRPGRPNLPGVGLFLWRLRAYSVTRTAAYCKEKGNHHFTFSVLGNDAPLYVKPEPETEPTHIAEELNVPMALGRRIFAEHKELYYGDGKSLQILRVTPVKDKDKEKDKSKDKKQPEIVLTPIPAEEIVVTDLSGWFYQPHKGQVAVDPELGRIAFPARHVPKHGIRVIYHYGFSADIGGGEYDRPLSQPAGEIVLRAGTPDDLKLELQRVEDELKLHPEKVFVFIYRVGEKEDPKGINGALVPYKTINDALGHWHDDHPRHAVIEIVDSRDYVEEINIKLEKDQTLQLRAARRARPVIRLLDRQTSAQDSLTVDGDAGSAFTLDGLLITGRGVHVEGDLAAVTVRHSTLVPGWGLHGDCAPREPAEPSLELLNVRAEVAVEHSIVGSILVNQDEVATDPVRLRVSDSIVDATGKDLEAVSAPDGLAAHALLTVQRSTVFGKVLVHALELGEDSLFAGLLRVARRQLGCLRFSSYVPGERSRTPRRFECQPDLAAEAAVAGLTDPAERAAAKELARERVRPAFRSTRYGSPVYARLADSCAEEIRRGAEDESEMGVFHDLFEPQRAANLRARLDEYTPAGEDAGLIFADQEAP
ncbi:MAG TPA: hypothetical protein VGX68_18035 [Thermoanaerobaculia bacterium]|jgi:hypothetical protein|nr:hypothetical protein [Thermoanaerobaculia bacterium]